MKSEVFTKVELENLKINYIYSYGIVSAIKRKIS